MKLRFSLAMVVALLPVSTFCRSADCAWLTGRFLNQSERASDGGEPTYLAFFVALDKRIIEYGPLPNPMPQSSGPVRRPMTHRAQYVEATFDANQLLFTFFDRDGKLLATTPAYGTWRCDGTRIVDAYAFPGGAESSAGRLEKSFYLDEAGNLVHKLASEHNYLLVFRDKSETIHRFPKR